MKYGYRRRARAVPFDSPEDLVAAVMLRLSNHTGPMPKDDELAEEMNNAGFDTCEKEVFSIRHKNKIRHSCRGANKQSKHRRVTKQSNNEESSDDTDAESDADIANDTTMERQLSPLPAIPPKLIQSNPTNIITLDFEAIALVHSISTPIRKLLYDRVIPGVQTARHPQKVHEIARPLIENLLQSTPTHNLQITAMYISNNMFIPDPLFGCWMIPLDFHRERDKDRIDSDESDDPEEEEEQGRENWLDDINLRVGMAVHVSKRVAVHCRMTVLIVSR